MNKLLKFSLIVVSIGAISLIISTFGLKPAVASAAKGEFGVTYTPVSNAYGEVGHDLMHNLVSVSNYSDLTTAVENCLMNRTSGALGCSSYNGPVAATYIILTMLGESLDYRGNTTQAIAKAKSSLGKWKSIVKAYDDASLIGYSVSYSYSQNTMLVPGSGAPKDVKKYTTSDTRLAIVFRKPSDRAKVLYAIKKDCANPVGTLKPLEPVLSLDLKSEVRNDTNHETYSDMTTAKVDDTVRFRHKLIFSNESTKRVDWYVRGPGTGAYDPTSGSGMSASTYGSYPAGTSGTQIPPSFVFKPSRGGTFCQWIVATPRSGDPIKSDQACVDVSEAEDECEKTPRPPTCTAPDDIAVTIDPNRIFPNQTPIKSTVNSSADYSKKVMTYRWPPGPNTKTDYREDYYDPLPLPAKNDNTRLGLYWFIVPKDSPKPKKKDGASSGRTELPRCKQDFGVDYVCELTKDKHGEGGSFNKTITWPYEDSRYEVGSQICYMAAASWLSWEDHVVHTTYQKHTHSIDDYTTSYQIPHTGTRTNPDGTTETYTYYTTGYTTHHNRTHTVHVYHHQRRPSPPSNPIWNYEYSKPACAPIAQVGFAQVSGNDLIARNVEGYTLKAGATTSEYGILASGSVRSVASNAGFNGHPGHMAVNDSLYRSKLTFGSSSGGFSTSASPNVSSYLLQPGRKGFTLRSSGTSKISSALASFDLESFDGSVVLNVSGNLTIDTDVIYSSGNSVGSSVPQLVIIASGNILIDEDVEQIDAWLVARSGYIDTCNGKSKASLKVGVCDESLTINGPIIASRVLLKRTYYDKDKNSAAERLNMRGDAYIWAKKVSEENGNWTTTYTTDLPPRF